MQVYRVKSILALALFATVILTAFPGNAQTLLPLRGVFAINAVQRGKVNPTILNNTNVDGIVLLYNWSDVEPREGTFNWTTVDKQIAQIAAAGKKAEIAIVGGYETPSWVYADGAQQFRFVWDLKWGPAPCSVQNIPVPWDSVYLSKWGTMMAVFGARYNSNPTVAAVKLTGINSKTPEEFLPSSDLEKIHIGSRSCTGYDDVLDWQLDGYTRSKVETAWNEILLMTSRAFPNKPLAAMLVPGGFPPIDENGAIIPDLPVDHQIISDLIDGQTNPPSDQFVLQNDGLSATWIWQAETSVATEVATGYQTLDPIGSELQTAVNLAINGGAKFLELYPADISNPKTQSAVADAHNALD